MNWLTRTQVRNKINVGRTRMWELEKSGDFPKPHLLGSKALYIDNEIDEWMVAKREEGVRVYQAQITGAAE